ncbi:hypothetical protein GLOIN_2v1770597 [Rhizophagus irregularis DAOM 181602=DAOM 197198]|nr:hypothetical protein GLOIN_2v1770597 [Rhizophagus irregularis DAOM 181602=DAOM 197198]
MRASLKMNDSDEINVRLEDDLIEWIKVSIVKGDKDIICKICDRYMDKIQKLFWNKRCEETIELEKTRGITKELKRKRGKKVIESEVVVATKEKIKLKKIKIVTKNMIVKITYLDWENMININGDIKNNGIVPVFQI